MNKTFELIKTDIITMNGGKNNMRTIFVLMFVFCAVMGFLFSPMYGLIGPLMTGAFFVTMMFQNELKYHSEKLFCVLPITRRDLVNARYLLSAGLYTALFLIFYLLMLLSMKLKIYYTLFGDEFADVDRIAYLAEASGGMFTELGLFNLLYFTAFAFGIINITGELRKYFKNSEAFIGTLDLGTKKEARRKEFAAGMIVLGVMIVAVLAIADILPLIPILLPILATLLGLAQAADGFMLGVVIVAVAAFKAVYNYVCTVVEYDEKEL